MKKDDAELIIEAIDDRLKGVTEAMQSIKVNTDTIPEIHERLAGLEERVITIEKAVTETNLELSQLDSRVTVLEDVA